MADGRATSGCAVAPLRSSKAAYATAPPPYVSLTQKAFMEELLALLKDGRSRSVEMLAAELNTTFDDVCRKIEFLERTGIIKRVATSFSKDESLLTAGRTPAAAPSCPAGCTSCASCSGCSFGKKGGANGKTACSACMPKEGFKNMGIMWEVVK